MQKLNFNGKREVLHESCSFYRGQLLHRYTILEAHIDEIISSYFQSNENTQKRKEFMFVILSSEKMNWMHKVNIINYLIETYCPIFIDSYIKINKKKNPTGITFKTRLEKIIQERNKIAHRKYVPSNEYINERLDLIKDEITSINFETIKQSSGGGLKMNH